MGGLQKHHDMALFTEIYYVMPNWNIYMYIFIMTKTWLEWPREP